MCGIIGAWGPVKYEDFKRGLAAIAHRGPDGEGIFKNDADEILLGHRRLAILDLSAGGDQPFHYEHLSIVYNGEIYNFLELRKQLQQAGYIFRTESDTEVILAAYLEWGKDCLSKFNGMWAFVIWDNKEKSLFLSRDRFGKKPFFYSFVKGAFIFGSEMKAVTPFLAEVRPSDHFDWCFANPLQYESTDKCLIEGIRRFPAGSFAWLKKGDAQLAPQKFWDTKDHLQAVPESYEEQVEEFREIFIDACAIRMRSDVPIGTALSGGLDSSAILSTMVNISKTRDVERVSKARQHAFVACFKGTMLDERVYAEKVVKHLDVPVTYMEIDPAAGLDKLNNYLYLFEEIYLTSPVPMMEIYKAIRDDGVVVSIDGHGADELMGGYQNHITSALVDAGINTKAIRSILSADRDMYTSKLPKNAIAGNDAAEWYRQMIFHLKGRKNLAGYVIKDLTGMRKKEQPSKGIYGAYNQILHTLYHESVLPTLLRNYDRYSMASGVEIRMPFLDYRLAKYSFSLPWSSKIRNGYTKSLLRDAARPFMPEEITNRKSKIGFNTPIVEWMRGPWREFFMDNMESQSFKNSALVDWVKVKTAMAKVMTDPGATFGDGEYAWYLMTPYLWEQNFLNKCR